MKSFLTPENLPIPKPEKKDDIANIKNCET